MEKIRKILKDQLKENTSGADAVVDEFISTIELLKASNNKQISDANLNIEKALANIANADAEDVINEIYNNLCAIDEANSQLAKINETRSILFEDVPERTIVKGLRK